MKNAHRYLLATCFACLLPFSLWAEAPVVDESENFALLDEQQAANEQPVVNNNYYENDHSERALAHDSMDTDLDNNRALLNKIQGLQQDIQELRGQLEVQAHDIKLMQQQQLDFYKDLDGRLRKEPVKAAQNMAPAPTDMALNSTSTQVPAQTSNTMVPAAVPIPVQSGTPANPADEQISYLSAYELVKNKRYDEALNAMQTFITQYPNGGYSANAQYWLGELYMVKRDYPSAIAHFDTVLQQFPSSSKSSASLLKIGYALAASGKVEEAKVRLRQVIKTYPDTNTAQLATTKLRALETI